MKFPMDQIEHIAYFTRLFTSGRIETIPVPKELSVVFFKKGSGQYIYLIIADAKRYLARVNEYPLKNEWRIKAHEFAVLKMIEPLGIAPHAYYLDASEQELEQHFIIVDYIEGEPIASMTDTLIIDLANVLKKLHTSIWFEHSGNTLPPTEELPYKCDIYNEFANGEDKQIEKYGYLEGIGDVIEPYNRTKEKLGAWFHTLDCFDVCMNFCLCHADLKIENMLAGPSGIGLIDWECAGSDIPETDIGRAFAGCRFTSDQEKIFLKQYFDAEPESVVLERINAVKKVLEFFRILEDYILLNRKPWNANLMQKEIEEFESNLEIQ